jgi:hypothetical protein
MDGKIRFPGMNGAGKVWGDLAKFFIGKKNQKPRITAGGSGLI